MSAPGAAPELAASSIRFPPELPISARVADIRAAIAAHQVVIVAGATGSGKTTQLPKIALEAGRGTERLIGVTQPRRIAATSVAARVASELEGPLGGVVGYQIRFEDRTTPSTRVKFMTDGILLAEIQGDRLLRRYDTLVIDEAHERSLTIDFILGWLKRILPERRDLKVIISSATIETERFSEFFEGAPVIQVEGRTFPVDVLYEAPDPDLDLADAVAGAVSSVTSLDPRGDILVFLPGEREIREAEHELTARKLRHTLVQPLYARLSAADQRKVFASIPERRVILATNVAETSLTIPGIVYVIDTGVARLARYDARTGTTRLQIEAISRASAEQRKGRCGRVRDGICVRLYDEESFEARPAFTDPEMKRVGLAGVILRMKSYGLGAVEDFPFLDAPHSRSISEGYRVLEELGALDRERELTPLGRQLARFPVDPRIGRMILAAVEYGCLREVLVLAAALNVQDPRERPRGLEQKADTLHQRFRGERSDFVGLLRLWEFVREAQGSGTSQLRRTCKENFLSFVRVREWMEVHRQLEDIVRELRIARGPQQGARNRPNPRKGESAAAEHDAEMHKALLSGLLSRIGMWNAEQRVYVGARQTRFVIHPASALAKKPPAWVMAFELVQTSQLFARTVAKIEPEWLDAVGGHLLKRSYGEPHWSEKSARASVKERATLFGLPVFRDRSVDFAQLSPVRARLMFLEHALVRGEYKSRGAFQEKNRELMAEVARLRDKARRSDMLADDEALLAFFDARVPESVVNGKTFEAWREQAERSDPSLLLLSIDDVLARDEPLSPDDYPDSLTLHGVELPLTYRFEPGAEDDGVTLNVPLALLPQIDAEELEWTIPAWHTEKITALLETLPKSLRKEVGPARELAPRLAAALKPFEGPMLRVLARSVSELTRAKVPVDAFRPDAMTPHLRLNLRVLGERANVVAQSKDAGALIEQLRPRAREAIQSTKGAGDWERSGVTRWEFGDLPAFITRKVLGAEVRLYPALVDRGKAVDLALLEASDVAESATRLGLARLLALAVGKALSAIGKRVPPPFTRRAGLLVPRAESDAFRELVLMRTVQEGFGILAGGGIPRSKAQFDALLALGTPRLEASFQRIVRAISAAASELEKTARALDSAAKQPSGAAAVRDVHAQLDALFPRDLLRDIELSQLDQYPRYLRAVQTRLARAVNDPRKDAEKAAPFAPLWTAFLAKRETTDQRDELLRVRWLLEELRVAIFAPELKPALPVSTASVTVELGKL
ncbi:MAG TPA: ATP-dependent RNA helicase HrpA [Polyangiaceae bacterium]